MSPLITRAENRPRAEPGPARESNSNYSRAASFPTFPGGAPRQSQLGANFFSLVEKRTRGRGYCSVFVLVEVLYRRLLNDGYYGCG